MHKADSKRNIRAPTGHRKITSHSSSFNGLAVAATLEVSYNLLCHSHENIKPEYNSLVKFFKNLVKTFLNY
jgi:hypothetical protein